jgi:hypothetical protein
VKTRFNRLITLQGILICGLLLSNCLWGHEVRPAFLGLEQRNEQTFELVWKRPTQTTTVADITPEFPSHCQLHWTPPAEITADAKVQRGTLRCAAPGLGNAELHITGLNQSLIDVLLRVQWLDGNIQQQLIQRHRPYTSLYKNTSLQTPAYLSLGIEHILEGYDHLLFVAALMLLVTGMWTLLKTITAFTLAHSLTLALATLGLVKVPATPVETLIALSIALLAAEAIQNRRGKPSLTARHPWVIAFGFGLLHGLGFAGALAEIGLPQSDIPMALLLFNVGIELGQLVFISVIWLISLTTKNLSAIQLNRLFYFPAYTIGTVGAFWGIERMLSMFL